LACQEWKERVALYVGEDLDSPQAAEVEAHLRQCPGCAELARALEEDRARLSSAPAETFQVDYAAIRREIRTGIARDRHRATMLRLLAAAALVACAAAAGWLARLDGTVPPPPKVVARTPIPPAPLVSTVKPRRQAKSNRPSRAEFAAVAAALEALTKPESLPQTPAVLRVPTRDPDVVILWVPETKGDDHHE
jgi:hypothetical protein